jgi:hypothetical protein
MKHRLTLGDYKKLDEDMSHVRKLNKIINSLSSYISQEGVLPNLIIKESCDLLQYLFVDDIEMHNEIIHHIREISKHKPICESVYYHDRVKILLFIISLEIESQSTILTSDYENHHCIIRSCIALSHMIISEFNDIEMVVEQVWKIQTITMKHLELILSIDLYNVNELNPHNVYLTIIREIQLLNNIKSSGSVNGHQGYRLDNLVFLVGVYNWSIENTPQAQYITTKQKAEIHRQICAIDDQRIDDLTMDPILSWKTSKTNDRQQIIMACVCISMLFNIVPLILMKGWIIKLSLILFQVVLIILVAWLFNTHNEEMLSYLVKRKSERIKNKLANWGSLSTNQNMIMDVFAVYMKPFEIRRYES